MRVKHKANVSISLDTAGRDKLFALDDTLAEVTLDGCQEANAGTVAVAALGTLTVPFGGISVGRGFFLRSTGDFTLSVNGAAGLPVKRGPTGAAGAVAASARVLMEAQVSSLVVTAGSAALVLTYAVWGDPLS